MPLSPEARNLLKRISINWPGQNKVASESIESIIDHPFKGELVALQDGDPCSLPFYIGDKIHFLTIAPNVTEFNNEINLIRAWIIPSFAWERFEDGPGSSIVTKNNPTKPISNDIFSLSPPPFGYFTWSTSKECADIVFQKLKDKRALSEKIPKFTFNRAKHLSELREQFSTGMAIGDEDSTKEAIDKIRKHKLDHRAINIELMRIKFIDKFGKSEEIVKFEGIEQVLSRPISKSIRGIIVSAFHNFYLKELEGERLNESIEKYTNDIHDILLSSLNNFKVSDGIIHAKLLLYKAIVSKEENGLVKQVQKEPYLKDDSIVNELLDKLSIDSLPKEPSKEDFYRLYKSKEWLRLQELGLSLIELNKIEPSDLKIFESLKKSLNYCANERIQTNLEEIFGACEVDMPQNWKDFCEALKEKNYEKAKLFLQCDERSDVSQFNEKDINKVIKIIHSMVEEIKTGSDNSHESLENDVIEPTLTLIIDEFISETQFPRDNPERKELYFNIFEIWFWRKQGSLKPQDGSLLLTLADGLLFHKVSDEREREIVNILKQWWETRKVPDNLDYLLNSIELIGQKTEDRTILPSMWIDGADLIRTSNYMLTPSDKDLWKNIGAKTGLDQDVIDEYIGEVTSLVEESEDCLKEFGFKKIAIVSLHEKSALMAAEHIKKRTGATVIVVSEHVAGTQTKEACAADVILFVWTQNKHAVFRAFDNVRDKVAYVAGTGVTSIIRSLEKWTIKKMGR